MFIQVGCQRSSAFGLYNLSCTAASHAPMIQARVPQALVHLMSQDDVETKRLAVMTIANLAANSETRASATRGGALQVKSVQFQSKCGFLLSFKKKKNANMK